MPNRPAIEEMLIEFMRDDGIDESFIEYITYAISQVLICDAVQEAIDDGTIMVGADGHIHFFNETLH